MRLAIAWTALVLLVLCAYAPVRSAPFLYEDTNFVSENPAVLGHEPIQIGRARWLANVVNRAQWLASPTPRAFHLGNVALHLGNGLLVAGVAWTLTASPVVAWLTAAIFLVSPLQTEAVAYVAGRTELLACLCALSAWLLAARAGHWWHHGLVWLLIVAAISAKETAVVILPLLAFAGAWQGRGRIYRVALWLLPTAGMAWSVWHFEYLARSSRGAIGYAAVQAVALWRYLALVLVPWGLTIDHDFARVSWPVLALALISLGTVALVLAFAWMPVGDETRTIRPLWRLLAPPAAGPVLIGLLWAGIALAPRFVMRIPEVLNEHQLYFPMVGISLALAAPIGAWLESA